MENKTTYRVAVEGRDGVIREYVVDMVTLEKIRHQGLKVWFVVV